MWYIYILKCLLKSYSWSNSDLQILCLPGPYLRYSRRFSRIPESENAVNLHKKSCGLLFSVLINLRMFGNPFTHITDVLRLLNLILAQTHGFERDFPEIQTHFPENVAKNHVQSSRKWILITKSKRTQKISLRNDFFWSQPFSSSRTTKSSI